MRGSSPSEVRPAPRLPRARARSASAQKVAHAPLQFVSPPLRPAGDRARLAAFEPCRDFEPRPAHLPPPPSPATRRSDPRHWIRGCGCLGGSVSVLRGWRATKQREEARAGALRAQRASVQVRSPLTPRPAAVPGAAIRRRRRDDPRTRFAPFASEEPIRVGRRGEALVRPGVALEVSRPARCLRSPRPARAASSRAPD